MEARPVKFTVGRPVKAVPIGRVEGRKHAQRPGKPLGQGQIGTGRLLCSSIGDTDWRKFSSLSRSLLRKRIKAHVAASSIVLDEAGGVGGTHGTHPRWYFARWARSESSHGALSLMPGALVGSPSAKQQPQSAGPRGHRTARRCTPGPCPWKPLESRLRGAVAFTMHRISLAAGPR